jgi:hypothetical protein
MSAMKDHNSKEKEGQDRSHVMQFYEDRIFNQESEPVIIATKVLEKQT